MGRSRGIVLIVTVGIISFLVACGGGNSSGGNGGGGLSPSPPAAPTGLAAIVGDQVVALSWNASGGATSYHVKRGTVSGGPYTQVAAPSVANLFRYRFDGQHEVLLRGDGGKLQRRERKFQRSERDADCAPARWGDLIVRPCDGRRAGEPACDQPVRVWRQFPIGYGLRYRFRSDLRTLGRQCQHALQLAKLRNQCCSRLVFPESADG